MLVASGVAVADFSESSKVGSAYSPISIHPARNFPLVSRPRVIVRVLSRRDDLGRKKEREGRRTWADGNHFLVGARSVPVRIQPESRFDYVVRVAITISKQRAVAMGNVGLRTLCTYPRRDTSRFSAGGSSVRPATP